MDLTSYLREQREQTGLDPLLVVEKFCEEFPGLYYRQHPEFPNLVLIKYFQEPGWNHSFVRQCRGVIVDADDFSYVSRPFDKFFNYGTGNCDEIDWEAPFFSYEKEDGTFIGMYFYAGRWRVQTLGSPSAAGNISKDNEKTFAELFWETFSILGLELPPLEQKTSTFMFELCSPENQVVVEHSKAKIVFLGSRDNASGFETLPSNFPIYKGIACKTVPLSSIEEIKKYVSSLRGNENEGLVITQVSEGRVKRAKLKSPDYLLRHKGVNLSDRNILQIILSGDDDFVALETHENFVRVKEYFDKTCFEIEKQAAATDSLTKKQIGILFKDLKYQSYFFFRRDGRGSVREWFCRLTEKRAIEIVEDFNAV